jgi:hypothetical protein
MTEPDQRIIEQRAITEEQARLGVLLAEMILNNAFHLITNDFVRLARKLLRR